MAAVLSFIMPGLGHLYTGRIFQGLLWWIVLAVLYVASIFTLGLGLLLAIPIHLLCIIDAQREDGRKRKREMEQMVRMMRK